MNTPFNPLQTDGFEFVEFSAPTPEGVARLRPLFEHMGFRKIGQHKRKNISLYRQGDINFLVNDDPASYFRQFSVIHGPCACAMAFRVKDANAAFNYAINHGARPFDKADVQEGEVVLPAVYGIGDSILYFVDTYGEKTIYDTDFDYFENADLSNDGRNEVSGHGLSSIDHLTHNVYRGHMDTWANFYTKIGNFREIRFFDIEGKLTGLKSRAMTSPCGKIRIPINESSDDKSQIEEYLQAYHGEGIQHIALATDDIYQTVESMRSAGMQFMKTPAAYYRAIDQRVPQHGESIPELERLAILIDGNPAAREGVLLQIFTDTVVGPIFFEIIQRKGNEGFGEGNFQALFESIEQDQIERGVLQDPTDSHPRQPEEQGHA